MELTSDNIQDNKLFLESLYKTKSIKTFLSHSTDQQLDILLLILYTVVSGRVPLGESGFDRLIRMKKLPFLRFHFESRVGLDELVSGSRSQKMKCLTKLNKAIHIVLDPIIN